MKTSDFGLRIVAFTLMFLLISACAKPNYQNIQPLNQTQQEPTPDPQSPKPTDPVQPEPTPCALFFTTEQLCIHYKWTKTQTSEQMGEMEVSFSALTKPDVKVDPLLKPFLKLWMPEHGHGSRPVVVEKIETGKYRISKVFFSMPGKWQLRFQLLNEKNEIADQVIDEITF